jgi:hypothetical protein
MYIQGAGVSYPLWFRRINICFIGKFFGFSCSFVCASKVLEEEKKEEKNKYRGHENCDSFVCLL